jgi:hypothetical protein
MSKDLNGDLYLISDEYNIKKSIDDGSIWTDFSSVPGNEIGLNLLFTANQIFLITTNADYTIFKIYYSNKNNINWQNITSQFSSDTTFNELKYIDNKVFVCTSNGLFYYDTSTNNYSDTCNNVSGSLTQGLVGYWPFCGNANDDSGNGNNGTVNGATLTTDRFGNSNSAYVFDGIDNFISFPQKFNFHNAGDASISIWIKSNSIPNALQATFLKSRISSTDNNRFNFFLNPISGNLLKLNFDYRESNFNIHILNINNIQLNTWQNIIYTRTGNTYNLYINGTFINSSVDNLPNLPTEIGWVIGNDPSSNSDFSGLIDDIGIWNRALNQQDITNLYNANQCFNLITVTDTLIINVGQLSYNNPVTYANNITIAPNPASSQININFNNITDLNGGTLKVINSLGQEVATTPITTSGTNSTMQLATWGGTGIYFVQIINPQGQIVDIKKIILQ